MEPHCFIRNELVPLAQARVSPDDLGLLRSFAVYEGLASFDAVPFHFTDHYDRLCRSAESCGLSIPLSKKELFDGLSSLLQKNVPTGRGTIRAVLSGGPAIGGIEYDPQQTLFYALAEPAELPPETVYTEGARLITHEHLRFQPHMKTTSYFTAVTLQPARKKADAIEVLYTHEGNVLECATSNIGLVKDGRIIIPGRNVLKGITMEVLLRCMADTHEVERRDIPLEECLAADEVFITASFKDVVPIVKIDDQVIGNGTPGPVTQTCQRLFQAHIDSKAWMETSV